MKSSRLHIIAFLVASLMGVEAYALDWDVSVWGKRRAFTENVEKLAELVSAKTNGGFNLKISYGGLSKSRENLDGIAAGAFEMAQFCSFYHTKKNPSLTVVELPFSRNLSLTEITKIYNEVHQHPTVVKDLARWNATIIMPTPLPQYNLVSKSRELTGLDGFDGLRIRGPGGILGVLGKLGAVKTSVPFSEVRQSMDSGVIDAAAFAPHAHLAVKSYKVGKWATTNLNLGSANCPVVVNTEALKSLSLEFRSALLDSVNTAMTHYVDNYENVIEGKYQKELDNSDIVQVTFNDNEVKRFEDLSQSFKNDWVKKYAKSFNSQELLTFTEQLFDK